MACGCRRSKTKYVWTSDDGAQTTTYDSEVAARAKVIRRGGSYKAVTG